MRLRSFRKWAAEQWPRSAGRPPGAALGDEYEDVRYEARQRAVFAVWWSAADHNEVSARLREDRVGSLPRGTRVARVLLPGGEMIDVVGTRLDVGALLRAITELERARRAARRFLERARS